MPRKVFWEDRYQTALGTRIAGVGGHPVLAARKHGHEIFYTLAPRRLGRKRGSRSTGRGATA